jgi:hypothetical protein
MKLFSKIREKSSMFSLKTKKVSLELSLENPCWRKF